MSCGDYGGRTRKGRPCALEAGWGTEHSGTGRCRQHDDGSAASKAEEQELAADQPRKAAGRGCLYKTIGAPLALAGAFCAFAASQSMRPSMRMDWEDGALLGAAGVVMLTVGGALLTRGKKLTAPTAEEVLAKDPRPPVVYLRSFEGDAPASKVYGGQHGLGTQSEEEQLAEVMEEIGPFVAIGKPGEKLATLGAARMYVPDANWRQEVDALLARSRLVVLRAGNTDGFWWEVERSVRKLRPEQIVFLVPADRELAEAFRERASRVFPQPLPEELRGRLHIASLQGVLYFESDWTPRFVPFRKRVFRSSVARPVAPKLKEALEKVFEQAGVRWDPPGVSPIRVYFAFLLFITFAGLVFLAVMLATGQISLDD